MCICTYNQKRFIEHVQLNVQKKKTFSNPELNSWPPIKLPTFSLKKNNVVIDVICYLLYEYSFFLMLSNYGTGELIIIEAQHFRFCTLTDNNPVQRMKFLVTINVYTKTILFFCLTFFVIGNSSGVWSELFSDDNSHLWGISVHWWPQSLVTPSCHEY